MRSFSTCKHDTILNMAFGANYFFNVFPDGPSNCVSESKMSVSSKLDVNNMLFFKKYHVEIFIES